MSTGATASKRTTLSRMVCDHGMPSPASCADCMDEGVFLPAQARRAHTGQHSVAGTYALAGDCAVQAITNAFGVTYLEAAEAFSTVPGWVPGRGATRAHMAGAAAALGFELRAASHTLASALADGGTFIVRGYRGRRGHAWVIENGCHINGLGWEHPGRTAMRYEILTPS